MKLKVPDYYEQFSCIADQCRDSCCIGWEIDIDNETYEYYRSIQGELGTRLRESMILTEDMEHSFQLKEHGRCPFLNEKNLCELCIELGEESLCEVCTEYPRFTLEYGEVVQKTLSLSCEEVGRMLFTREKSVSFIEKEPEWEDVCCEDIDYDEECKEQQDSRFIKFCERIQEELIKLLQNRAISIWQRIRDYLQVLQNVQNRINEDTASNWDEISIDHFLSFSDKNAGSCFQNLQENDAYLLFFARFSSFSQMETLDIEWENVKEELKEHYTRETYSRILTDFLQSSRLKEKDYEHLMVYFTFRYFMNCVYDYDMLSYGKMAVIFTLMIRDMDALRFMQNQGRFHIEDRIDIARIFSKEVEHSIENVEYAREEFMFGEEFSIEKLCTQI